MQLLVDLTHEQVHGFLTFVYCQRHNVGTRTIRKKRPGR